MERLPEDCVSSVLSFTSPLDACRSSMVSSFFRQAADSDVVWEKLLPSDHHVIVSSSVTPLNFSSKKELYFQLCNPVLIDNGRKSFTLEKNSGKISYILSARELSIRLSSDPMYWSWKSIPESRFEEVAELKQISRLEIHGKIRTQMLSPNTTYRAYLITKVSEGAYGLDTIPSEVSVQVGNQVSSSTAYLCRPTTEKQQMECLFYRNRLEMLIRRVKEGERRAPTERGDGLMEIELGEFLSGEGHGEVKMSLLEAKGSHLKAGLIIEGIEVRPCLAKT